MVQKVITDFDSFKASSLDFIPVVVPENCEPELSYILADLFNMYEEEYCCPDVWEVSSMVALLKNVEENSVTKNFISAFLSDRRLQVALDGKSSQECPVIGVYQGSILGTTLFLLYIKNLLDEGICIIAIYAGDTTKCNRTLDLWQQLELTSGVESDLRDAVDWGKK